MDRHLELDGVAKRFGLTQAVDGLSFSVPSGCIFGLLGPNGAGKTTTIRMIMRITLPDSGEIRLGGQVIDDEIRERIGYLPEERGLYRKMRVGEQLAFLAEVRGIGRAEAKRRSQAWLEKLGLAHTARHRVEELSKGMQQKVQFAGAVIHEPEMVILDEPFTGLDPIATRLLRDELVAMRERGVTVVFSTHILIQAEELCDEICLINRGRAIVLGSLAEVRSRFTRPALRLVTPATTGEVAAVPGVAGVSLGENQMIVDVSPGVEHFQLIRDLAARLPVEAVEPYVESLEDIFLRAVEGDHVALG